MYRATGMLWALGRFEARLVSRSVMPGPKMRTALALMSRHRALFVQLLIAWKLQAARFGI